MKKRTSFAEIVTVLLDTPAPGRISGDKDIVAPTESTGSSRKFMSALQRANKKPHTGDDSMKTIDVIALILLIVGGLNWGLVGLAHFDLVAAIFGLKFGEVSTITSLVYILVALSAIYEVFSFKSIQTRWGQQEPARAR